MSKLCCFEMLEIMYSRLHKDDVNSKNSKINSVYCGRAVDSGKEMTTTVTKYVSELFHYITIIGEGGGGG